MSHQYEFHALVDEQLIEHVGGIMFDAGARPDPDCVLCKRAVEQGVWQRYGVDDPFAEHGDVS